LSEKKLPLLPTPYGPLAGSTKPSTLLVVLVTVMTTWMGCNLVAASTVMPTTTEELKFLVPFLLAIVLPNLLLLYWHNQLELAWLGWQSLLSSVFLCWFPMGVVGVGMTAMAFCSGDWTMKGAGLQSLAILIGLPPMFSFGVVTMLIVSWTHVDLENHTMDSKDQISIKIGLWSIPFLLAQLKLRPDHYIQLKCSVVAALLVALGMVAVGTLRIKLRKQWLKKVE
jgi:hypothetical protein